MVGKINDRITSAMGLDPEIGADGLQVANYGLGGHYGPHFDFSTDANPFESFGQGNRVATVLFYLSVVEAGGGTVFTRLNLAVTPRKGSAVFWYNMWRKPNSHL